jgi:hypothetical protein
MRAKENFPMSGGRIKSGFAVSLMASIALAIPAPLPRITVDNPNALYALAYWKVAVGDTEAAARLVTEAGKKNQAARHAAASQHTPAQHTMVSSRACPGSSKS